VAPAAVADGHKWTFLGTATVSNGWLMVKLTNKANGVVVADAIRIVQLPPADPSGGELAKAMIDNGAESNRTTGAWTRVTGAGFENDIERAAQGNGSSQSDWTFTGLPNGNYNVWATWTAAGSNASNAPYQFFNGSGTVTTIRRNQRIAPAATAEGYEWTFLDDVTVSDGWLMVRLNNQANGTVVADAIRVVQQPSAAAALAPTVTYATPLVPVSSLLAFASSGHQPERDLHALPLPNAASHLPSLARAAHEHVWSQPADVAAELSVLEQVTDLLAELNTEEGRHTSDFWAEENAPDNDWLAVASDQ
jgi:hypothetical protein